MLTLGYAKLHLAPFADGGICVNDANGPVGYNRLTLRIQEAVQRLMLKPGCPQITQCVRVCMANGCITAARDVERFVRARIDGETANVFDKWYEFLEGGPGMVENDHTDAYKDLVDRGLVATQYDPPEPMKLGVCSDTEEAATAWMLIQGYDETDREVRSKTPDGVIMGEYVPVRKDVLCYTQALFSKVKAIIKPRTNGYVMLGGFEFDDVTGALDHRHHLAWYHPDDERPEFRRYAFKTPSECPSTDKFYKLHALAQMKFVPFWRDTDLIWPDNIPMIKFMLQAMKYYDTGDPEAGKAYETLAENMMLEVAAKHETVQAIPDIQMMGFGGQLAIAP
jgi:hypothetical protein